MTSKPQHIETNQSIFKLWEVAIIFLLAFAAYGNSIKNQYNIDDAYIVPLDSQNEIIKDGLSAIPKLLLSRYNVGEGVTYGYRPMGKITMVLEYMMWGNNPHNSHIVNIILFALNVVVLLLFLRMLTIIGITLSKEVIYIALLLFIFHPIHTEVVSSIKNREEILCFTFLITALIFFIQFFRSKNYFLLIPFLLSLIVSMLSKETSFNVFGWIVLLTVVGSRYSALDLKFLPNLKRGLIFFGITGFLFYLIFVQLRSHLPVDDIAYSFEQNPYKSFPSVLSFPNGIQTLLFYLKKLIIPSPLLFYYGYDMMPVQNWSMVWPYLGILMLVLVALYCIRNFKLKQTFEVPFLICAFGISVFPFSNIIPATYVTGIVAERLVYQASLPFCVVLSMALISVVSTGYFKGITKNNKLIIGLILIPILSSYLYLTVKRNENWRDKETLYEHDIKYLSKSARANYMIANTYMKSLNQSNQRDKRVIINKAKTHLTHAINVYPDYSEAKVKLGIIYGRYLNNIDSAFIFLESIVKDSSTYHLSGLEELGDLSMLKFKDEKLALRYYEEYWRIDKSNKFIYQKIQNVLFNQNRYDLIVKYAKDGIAQDWLEAYIDLGDALMQLGHEKDAMNNYKYAISRGYKNEILKEKVKKHYKKSPYQ